MGSRYRRFPSLQALVGFEAAARLQSFSRAADELSMTQSAVSHQIRALEDSLGQALFRRQGRSVQLTDAGRDMLETTRRTLATLDEGLGRLDYYIKPGSVVITCPPAFARHWLMPRLPSLRDIHPAIDPWIVSTDAAVDFSQSENDMCIALATDAGTGLTSVVLANETLGPLCSPDYRPRLGKRRPSPKTLAKAELLHDESWDGWNRWFETVGLEERAPVRGFNFSDPGLALDAALAGQGVALGSHTLASRALAEGRLLALGPTTIQRQEQWMLRGDPDRLRNDAERRFWDWLIAQAGKGST